VDDVNAVGLRDRDDALDVEVGLRKRFFFVKGEERRRRREVSEKKECKGKKTF